MTDTASETIRYALALVTLVAIGVAVSRTAGSPYLWVPFGLLLGGLLFARPWARPVGAVVLGPYLLWLLIGDYGTRWGPTVAALGLVAVAASYWRNPVAMDEPPAGDGEETEDGDGGDTEDGDSGDTEDGDSGDTEDGDSGDTEDGDSGDTEAEAVATDADDGGAGDAEDAEDEVTVAEDDGPGTADGDDGDGADADAEAE
jgi:hypothetical protein